MPFAIMTKMVRRYNQNGMPFAIITKMSCDVPEDADEEEVGLAEHCAVEVPKGHDLFLEHNHLNSGSQRWTNRS